MAEKAELLPGTGERAKDPNANAGKAARGLARSERIDRSKVKAEDRTIEVAFSSEEPVERWGENEVLSHEKGDYDFSRLNDSHPLLLGHAEWDPRSQIGVIESARVDSDKIGRAVVRFGNSELAEEIFQDVKDGIRKLISVGYDRTGIRESKKAKDGMVTTTYRWMPTHIAIVPVPADTRVGVGRDATSQNPHPGPLLLGKGEGDSQSDPKHSVDSQREQNAEHIFEQLTSEQKARMKVLLDSGAAPATGAAPTVDEGKIRSEGGKEALRIERERIKKIRDIGNELMKDKPEMAEQIRTMVQEAEEKDTAVGDFQIRAMQEVIKAKPVKQVTMASLGFDEQDARSYSLVRAIQSCVENESKIPSEDTIEGEAHKRMMKLDMGAAKYSGFRVPADAGISSRSLSMRDRRRMGRDLQVGVFAQGGATVATELMTPIIEILRNRMVTSRFGVRTLAGLTGNVVIPRQTGAGTAYSVSEIGGLTVSTQALDQIALAPKRVGAQGIYSKTLVLQSSVDVEQFLRDDFLKVIAIDWDRLILNGSGAGDEPLGIMQCPGIFSLIFGGAATWANLVKFETLVATANADIGDMGYISTPSAKGVLKSAAKLLVGATTVAAAPLWDGPLGDGSMDGLVNGYRAASTNQMPNNQMLFGVFSEVIHALWGGYDVVIDPYSLAGNAEVKITINTWGEVAERHPQCFCLSVDSAAQ
jgi:HK97 family phage major capsid protein